MSIGRSSNPAMRDSFFEEAERDGSVMTVNGAIEKTCILLMLVVFSASFGWKFALTSPNTANSILTGGAVLALVFGLITSFFPKISPFTSVCYALTEGAVLGVLSLVLNKASEGIALQAVVITLLILALMLFLYRTGIIQCTSSFKNIVIIATAGACFGSIAIFALQSFGLIKATIFETYVPYGFIISLVMCGLAAFNYIVDFDIVVKGAENRAPKYMEWYAAYGIMVTTVWLYLEILKILANSRKK